jgi:hypothetical protein
MLQSVYQKTIALIMSERRRFKIGQKGHVEDEWRTKPRARTKPNNGLRPVWRHFGPFAKGATLAMLLDRRTNEGKFAFEVERALVDHVGGEPTGPQLLLIKCAALKALRIALMSRKVVTNESLTDLNDRQLVCWMNSLRRDLQALGMERPEQQPKRLADVLKVKAA